MLHRRGLPTPGSAYPAASPSCFPALSVMGADGFIVIWLLHNPYQLCSPHSETGHICRKNKHLQWESIRQEWKHLRSAASLSGAVLDGGSWREVLGCSEAMGLQQGTLSPQHRDTPGAVTASIKKPFCSNRAPFSPRFLTYAQVPTMEFQAYTFA